MKNRLRTDIMSSFGLYEFDFNDKQDFQLPEVFKFVDFVAKLNQSMAIIPEYQRLFTVFNVNYIKTCFFTMNSAGDQVNYFPSIFNHQLCLFLVIRIM